MAVRTPPPPPAPERDCRASLLGAQLAAEGPRLGWPILGASLWDWSQMGDQASLEATLSTPPPRQVQHMSVPGGSGGLQPPPRCPPHGGAFPSMAAAHHAPPGLDPAAYGVPSPQAHPGRGRPPVLPRWALLPPLLSQNSSCPAEYPNNVPQTQVPGVARESSPPPATGSFPPDALP